jgi:hypothetical protein
MTIEFLYFDGCPNYERLLPHLQELLTRSGLHAEALQRKVETAEDAIAERFLGSPTVRVDGEDVEPGAAGRTDFGLKCRLYRTDAGLAGAPADELVLRALARAGGLSPAPHGRRPWLGRGRGPIARGSRKIRSPMR